MIKDDRKRLERGGQCIARMATAMSSEAFAIFNICDSTIG